MKNRNRIGCRIGAVALAACLLMGILTACGSKTADRSETVGNWSWRWDKSTKTLTVSGEGAMTDFGGASEAAWESFRDEVEAFVVEDGVTSVGSYACYSMPSLKTVSLGATVTRLGDFSFAYCNALTAVAFPSALQQVGDHAFEGCSALETVSLPDSVTAVGKRAFAFCTALSHVVLSGANTVLADGAFQNCRALSSVLVHSALQENCIASSAFDGAAVQVTDLRRSDTPTGTTVLTVRYLVNGAEIDRAEQLYDYGTEYRVDTPLREGYVAETEAVTGVADGQPRQVTVRYFAEVTEENGESSVVAKIAVGIMAVFVVGIGVAVVVLIRSDSGKKRKQQGTEKKHEE